MKKTNLIKVLGILSLMSVGTMFADEVKLSVEERYQMLENELQVLEAKEQDMFDEQEAKAAEAAKDLTSLQAMRTQIAGRINTINAHSKNTLLPAEMKDVAAQYQEQLKAIEGQIKEKQKVVTTWNELKNIRKASMIK